MSRKIDGCGFGCGLFLAAVFIFLAFVYITPLRHYVIGKVAEIQVELETAKDKLRKPCPDYEEKHIL